MRRFVAIREGRSPGFGIIEMVFTALMVGVAVTACAIGLLATAKAMPNEARCASGRQFSDNIATDAQAAGTVDGPLATNPPTSVGGTVTARSDGNGVVITDTGCRDSVRSIYAPVAAPTAMPT